jgi:hypothetical protein
VDEIGVVATRTPDLIANQYDTCSDPTACQRDFHEISLGEVVGG